jgi:predicted RNase H-like HicB family nuclease
MPTDPPCRQASPALEVEVVDAAGWCMIPSYHTRPSAQEVHMEHMINLHIEKLPEGVYLATSDVMQGLVAQGRTIQETIEIARDVAKKLLEAAHEREGTSQLPPL